MARTCPARNPLPASAIADPADGTVANQRQSEDRLFQPLLGDREVEENLLRRVLPRRKCLLEGLLGTANLLIDELAADLVLCSQSADRFCSCQDVQGQVLPLFRPHCLGRAGNRDCGLRTNARNVKMSNHVCFLHETG